MPISTTASSLLASRAKRVIGTPMRLLRLPTVRATDNPVAASAAAVSSLVVVLPAEPVIATTVPPQARR